jgi:hypothetical protein
MSESNSGKDSQVSNSRRFFVVVTLVLAGLLLFALVVRPTHASTNPNSSNVKSSPSQPAYSYTCCSGSVMNAIYHPGSVITIHWIRKFVAPTQVPATSINLSLSLSGPYRTVASLKTDSIGAHPRRGRTKASAKRIVVLDTAFDSPVSILRVPNDARSGYYNLTTTIGTKSLTVSGSGVIRIEAPGK